MERIKNNGREFSDFHISLFLQSLRFVNCSLWFVTARQYWTYILVILPLLLKFNLSGTGFCISSLSKYCWSFVKFSKSIHEPGGCVLFELGVGSPWSSPPGKIREPKWKSIIEDGIKSYLFNKVLRISSIACFLQLSFDPFIRIRCTGYKEHYYLPFALHLTRCINVTPYNPVIDWFPINGNQEFYY